MEALEVKENSSTAADPDPDPDPDHDIDQEHHHHVLNHREEDVEEEVEEAAVEEETEEVRDILQVIAATGNFWRNWEKLKRILSFQLKLVLSEYPEAKMTTDEQLASLGELYQELVMRLDEELHCFIDGPPFTLQRICEILLAARSIYPKLSKLALALEKNLLVTSILTVSTKPYPKIMTNPEPEKASNEAQPHSNSGNEPVEGDRDEIMTEVEEADIDDMTIDMDAFQDMVGSSEANSTAAAENS